MANFLYSCKQDIFLSRLEIALGLQRENILVPIHVLSLFHASGNPSSFSIPFTAQMCLEVTNENSRSTTLVFDKEVIIKKTNSRFVPEESLQKAALHVPITCGQSETWTLFVEAEGQKDLLVPSGTIVMCIEKSTGDALRVDAHEDAVEGIMRERRQMKKYRKLAERRLSRQKLQEELQTRLDNLKSPCSSPSFQFVKRVRELTVDKIKALKRVFPLYYLPSSSRVGSSVTVGKTKWVQPHHNALYQVFQPMNTTHSAKSSEAPLCASSSSVAFFFLNGVLLCFSNASDTYLVEKSFQVLPLDGFTRVAKVMKQLFQKGFRIVVIEHIPSLHYGSAAHIEVCLGSITSAMNTLAFEGGCSITVLLSMRSNICSLFDTDVDDCQQVSRSPHDLWYYFVDFLNNSAKPDFATSFLVGSSSEKFPVEANVHKQFAAEAGIQYKELDVFLQA